MPSPFAGYLFAAHFRLACIVWKALSAEFCEGFEILFVPKLLFHLPNLYSNTLQAFFFKKKIISKMKSMKLRFWGVFFCHLMS